MVEDEHNFFETIRLVYEGGLTFPFAAGDISIATDLKKVEVLFIVGLAACTIVSLAAFIAGFTLGAALHLFFPEGREGEPSPSPAWSAAPLGLASYETCAAWTSLFSSGEVLEPVRLDLGTAALEDLMQLYQSLPKGHQKDIRDQTILFGPFRGEGRTYAFAHGWSNDQFYSSSAFKILMDSGAATEMMVREEALDSLLSAGCLLWRMELSDHQRPPLSTMKGGRTQPRVVARVGLMLGWHLCPQEMAYSNSKEAVCAAKRRLMESDVPGIPIEVYHVAFVVQDGGEPDLLMGCQCLGRNSIIPRCQMRNGQLITACHLEFGTILSDRLPMDIEDQLHHRKLNRGYLPGTVVYDELTVERWARRGADAPMMFEQQTPPSVGACCTNEVIRL